MFQSHDYCQVLSALIREHWSELNAFTTTEHFERNRVIFSVGDPSDAMFLIESGRVKVSLLSDKGEEKIVAICRKGEVWARYACVTEDRAKTRLLHWRL